MISVAASGTLRRPPARSAAVDALCAADARATSDTKNAATTVPRSPGSRNAKQAWSAALRVQRLVHFLMRPLCGELITPLSRRSNRSSPSSQSTTSRNSSYPRWSKSDRGAGGASSAVAPACVAAPVVSSGRACAADAGAAAASVALVVSVLLPGRPAQAWVRRARGSSHSATRSARESARHSEARGPRTPLAGSRTVSCLDSCVAATIHNDCARVLRGLSRFWLLIAANWGLSASRFTLNYH